MNLESRNLHQIYNFILYKLNNFQTNSVNYIDIYSKYIYIYTFIFLVRNSVIFDLI